MAEVDPQIAALEQELRDVRRRRMEAQRRAEGARTAEVALTRVQRDRSTRSSPKVDVLVGRVRARAEEVMDLWDGIDRCISHVERVRASSLPVDLRPFRVVVEPRERLLERTVSLLTTQPGSDA